MKRRSYVLVSASSLVHNPGHNHVRNMRVINLPLVPAGYGMLRTGMHVSKFAYKTQHDDDNTAQEFCAHGQVGDGDEVL